MWLCDSLSGITLIKRAGILSDVVLPTKRDTKLAKPMINVLNKSIRFDVGDSVYLATDKVGIRDESEFSLFFAGDYMIISLHWGELYQETNGTVQCCTVDANTNNKSMRKSTAAPNSITWRTTAELRAMVCDITKNKFNLKDQRQINAYVDNLVFQVLTRYQVNEQLYRFRLTEYVEVLALNEFEFITYAVDIKPVLSAQDMYVPITEETFTKPLQVKGTKRKTREDADPEDGDADVIDAAQEFLDSFVTENITE